MEENSELTSAGERQTRPLSFSNSVEKKGLKDEIVVPRQTQQLVQALAQMNSI